MVSTEHDTKGSSLSLLTCFVIGPIGDRQAKRGSPTRLLYDAALETFKKLIVTACDPMGIRPVRADQIDHTGDIPEQVFVRLRDSDIVIADLSGANPNVMYELGLRHAIGRLTIQIAERGNLPFDVTTIRTILFERTRAGYIAASIDLRKYIRQACDVGLPPLPATRIFRHSDTAIKPAQIDLSTKTTSLIEVSLFIDESLRQSATEYRILADCMERIGNLLKDIANIYRTVDKMALSKGLRHFNQRIDPILHVIREQCLSLESIRDRIDRALQIGLGLAEKLGPESIESLKTWRQMLRGHLTRSRPMAGMFHNGLEKTTRGAPAIVAEVLESVSDLLTRATSVSTNAPQEWISAISQTIKRINQ